jgi:hypothetical protein
MPIGKRKFALPERTRSRSERDSGRAEEYKGLDGPRAARSFERSAMKRGLLARTQPRQNSRNGQNSHERATTSLGNSRAWGALYREDAERRLHTLGGDREVHPDFQV